MRAPCARPHAQLIELTVLNYAYEMGDDHGDFMTLDKKSDQVLSKSS